MTKLMVIFGAGASSFSGPCSPAAPPLGNWLFDGMVNFKDGLPEKFVAEFGDVFRTQGFEAGMAAVSHLGSDIIIPVQRQTSLYLSQFEIRRGNYYLSLIHNLRSRFSEGITFATLNYDLLLEQALMSAGWNSRYNAPAKLDQKIPEVSVLKLHGSSNFLPILPLESSFQNNRFFGGHQYATGLPMEFAQDHAEIQAWMDEPRYSNLTPALSVYGNKKTSVYNQDFIDLGIKEWKEQLLQAKLIILIGINYVQHDNHLWDPLAHAPGVVAVVNPDYNAYFPWLKNHRKGVTFHLAKGFAEIERILCCAHLAY